MPSVQTTYFHDDLIKELICWVEQNLNDRLTMEKAAEITGYSQWYLQRLFKNKTGYSLGNYIRERRLTMAAFALRFTNMSILDISLYYTYDSQQTFTRSFKNKFRSSPGAYRKELTWTMKYITAPLTMCDFPPPVFDIVELPEMVLRGNSKIYFYPVNDIFGGKTHVHRDGVTRNLALLRSLSTPVWGISDYRSYSSVSAANTMELEYTIGYEVPKSVKHTLRIPACRYLKVTFTHDILRLNDFILYLHLVLLPSLNYPRLMQPDMEKYSYESASEDIICEYFIPLAC